MYHFMHIAEYYWHIGDYEMYRLFRRCSSPR